jgi:hypothetical protein
MQASNSRMHAPGAPRTRLVKPKKRFLHILLLPDQLCRKGKSPIFRDDISLYPTGTTPFEEITRVMFQPPALPATQSSLAAFLPNPHDRDLLLPHTTHGLHLKHQAYIMHCQAVHISKNMVAYLYQEIRLRLPRETHQETVHIQLTNATGRPQISSQQQSRRKPQDTPSAQP